MTRTIGTAHRDLISPSIVRLKEIEKAAEGAAEEVAKCADVEYGEICVTIKMQDGKKTHGFCDIKRASK